jgi:hypothetical protein
VLVRHRSARQLHTGQIRLQHNILRLCWFTHRYNWVHARMRSIYVAAAVGMAVAVLLIAPVVLTGASSAHADTNGYLRCVKSDAVPDPGVSLGDSLPIVRVIETGLNSGDSPAQVAQILVGMGVKPNHAATQVQCVMANEPPAVE